MESQELETLNFSTAQATLASGVARMSGDALSISSRRWRRPTLVCDLDLEARTRIQFKKKRPSLTVDHHIHPEVAQTSHIDRPCCHQKHALPMGDLYPTHGIACIRVVGDNSGSDEHPSGFFPLPMSIPTPIAPR